MMDHPGPDQGCSGMLQLAVHSGKNKHQARIHSIPRFFPQGFRLSIWKTQLGLWAQTVFISRQKQNEERVATRLNKPGI